MESFERRKARITAQLDKKERYQLKPKFKAMKSNYKINQTVYEVAVNILTDECVIEPQNILYVGNHGLYAEGNSGEWGLSFGEHTLSYYSRNNFKKDEVLKNSCLSFWTDTREEAENFKAEIDKILEFKKQLLTG